MHWIQDNFVFGQNSKSLLVFRNGPVRSFGIFYATFEKLNVKKSFGIFYATFEKLNVKKSIGIFYATFEKPKCEKSGSQKQKK